MGVFFMVFGNLFSGGARQGAHAEKTAALVSGGTLVQAALGRDLFESLPLDVLPAGQRPRGVDLETITLPRFADYQAGATPSLRYRPMVYAWDPVRKALLRGGKPLAVGLLQGVKFRWTQEDPVQLLVTLVGEGLKKKAGTLSLRFTAPSGTGGEGFFQPAPWHRGATPVPAS
jgi:hypothetical protein